MHIAIINRLTNKVMHVTSPHAVPCVGDNVDWVYTPMPVVTKVIFFPGDELCREFGVEINATAIVVVE